MEVNDLKRQLSESQSLANKYMNIFRKSFFSRLFSGLRKEDIENDTKLISQNYMYYIKISGYSV